MFIFHTMKGSKWIIPYCLLTVLQLCAGHGGIAAQEVPVGEETATAKFRVGISVSSQNLYDSQSDQRQVYMSLMLSPSLSIGQFIATITLPLSLRFPATGASIEIRRDDWIAPDDSPTAQIIETYLGFINLIAYGQQEDPFFITVGTISGATLGNGALFRRYTNTRFRPERRPLGTQVRIASAALDFPLFGVEGIMSNWSALDLLGARLYFEPFALSSVVPLQQWQVGITIAADRDPYNYVRYDPDWDMPIDESAQIVGGGIDASIPLFPEGSSTFTLLADIVLQKSTAGGQIGVEGRIVDLLLYHFDFWYSGANFVAAIFNEDYDVYRVEHFETVNTPNNEGRFSWHSRLGLILFSDLLTIEGLFEGNTNPNDDADFDAGFEINLFEGMIPGLTFHTRYIRRSINDGGRFLENTNIESVITFGLPQLSLSLGYDIRYAPYKAGGSPWIPSSGLSIHALF